MVFRFQDIEYIQGSREMPWNRPSKMKVYYYLIDGLLIDTGPSSLAEPAMAFFNARPINQVFLTHIHEDHAGMAYWLQENKQVPIYLHPGSVDEALREPELAPYRVDIWGNRPAFKASPAPDTISTGSCFFQVIDSPGHCLHHNVLYEKNKGWLFSGDLLSNLRPTSVFHEENLSQMIISIDKLLALQFDTVFCSHTGILRNGKDLFTHKLSYLLQLQEDVHDLRRRGLSDEEIDRKLFSRPNPLDMELGKDFSSYNMVHTL